MIEARFYVNGEAVIIEPHDPAIKQYRPRRVLRLWVVVLLVLAVAILGGSLDSWANPKRAETTQEITLDN